MSLNNFIPTLWSANILATLEKTHIFAELANKDYEGDISGAGDTVKISMIGDVTISNYSKNTNINAVETLDDAQTVLLIDQQKYFNFQIDDIDKRQQKPKLMAQATSKAGYGLRDAVDTYFAGLYADAGLKQNTNGSPVNLTSLNVEAEMLACGTTMTENDIPLDNRFMVVQPWVVEKFVLAGMTTKTANDALWVRGFVDRILGFDIFVSNNVSDGDGAGAQTRNIAGVRNESFTFAEAIMDVEAYRPELRFADALKGLHVYGGKIVRPDMTLAFFADKTAEA